MKVSRHPRAGAPRLAIAAVAAAALLAPALARQAEAGVAYALTDDNRLLQFDTATPAAISRTAAISGLAPAEDLLGIDVRPADGNLYGLGSLGQLYRVNAATGAATAVGAPLDPAAAPLLGRAYGFDFNPVVDRVRVVSDLGENLRLNPNDGTLAATDGKLKFLAGDENENIPAGIQAAAYTNNDTDAATGTRLYGIVSELGNLVLQDPPNEGGLKTVGSLGLDDELPQFAGFDIARDDVLAVTTAEPAFGALPALDARLYSIDLATGDATLVGTVGDGSAVLTGFALALDGGGGGGVGPNPIPLPPAALAAPLAAAVGAYFHRRMRRRERE